MDDLLDISGKVIPVLVVGDGEPAAVDGYTDGHHFYFDEANAAVIGAQLTGRLDLSGRPVTVERTQGGWSERRGTQVRPAHLRHIAGQAVYRFDDEWLFTVTFAHPRQPETN